MAGGKETPRQKMIGMMYLVLTALLALQIKDTVLEKFVLIESGLEEANESIAGYNGTIVEAIQANAANQGNKTGDLAVAKAAENIRKYTNGLITDLENLKNELGKETSGSDNPEEYYTRANLKKYEPQSNVMVTKNKAEELKKWLDDYPVQVNAAIDALGKTMMDEKWSESLAIKAEDISFYTSNEKRYKEELKQDYAQFNFYKAPLASVLAQLTFYQNQLYSKESEALNYVADLIGSGVTVGPDAVPDLGGLAPPQPSSSEETAEQPDEQVASNTGTTTAQPNTSSVPSEIPEADMLERTVQGIDYAQAVVVAKSNTVPAGLDFEAEAFLTFGNTALTPTVTRNGQSEEVINGRGVINFKTSARPNEYDANDLAKKSFDLEISMPDGTGGPDIKRSIKHEYFVARPVIEVVSKSVQALYRDCANNVTINVPSLGSAYNPEFRMSGGSFEKGSGRGEVLISPEGSEAAIQVYNGSLFIGTKTFPVRSAPLPEIKLLTNGKEYNPEAGHDGALNNISFALDVDPEWRESFPNDANYLVSKGEILVQRGRNLLTRKVIDAPDAVFSLRDLQGTLQPGITVIVKVEEVLRINFENKQIRSQKFANFTVRLN